MTIELAIIACLLIALFAQFKVAQTYKQERDLMRKMRDNLMEQRTASRIEREVKIPVIKFPGVKD